ncbi:MAG: hypothetical protein AAFX52_04245 [Pseudomonadota bacterium]
MKVKIAVASFVASTSLLGSSYAAPIQFTDRTSFQTASGVLTTESLDDINVTGSTDSIADQPTGVSITGEGGFGFFSDTTASQFISEGSGSLTGFDWNTGATALFEFDQAVVGFAIDFLDNVPPFNIDLTVNGETFNFSSNVQQDSLANGPLFLGVRDVMTPFTQVLLTSNEDNGFVSFDFIEFELASAAPIPVPTAALLFAPAALLVARRKANRSASNTQG